MVSNSTTWSMGLLRSRSTAGPDSTAWVAAAITCPGAALLDQCLGRIAKGAGGIDHVVHHQHIFILHVTHNVDHLADIGLLPPFIHHGQGAVQPRSKVPGTGYGAQIRGYHHIVAGMLRLY